jgi:hypothetical protein
VSDLGQGFEIVVNFGRAIASGSSLDVDKQTIIGAEGVDEGGYIAHRESIVEHEPE